MVISPCNICSFIPLDAYMYLQIFSKTLIHNYYWELPAFMYTNSGSPSSASFRCYGASSVNSVSIIIGCMALPQYSDFGARDYDAGTVHASPTMVNPAVLPPLKVYVFPSVPLIYYTQNRLIPCMIFNKNDMIMKVTV